MAPLAPRESLPADRPASAPGLSDRTWPFVRHWAGRVLQNGRFAGRSQMGDRLTEVGMIFDPNHLACQVHEVDGRLRDSARIGRSTSRVLPHVADIDQSEGFAFGRAAPAQIGAVLREEIYELTDDFGRTLKEWIGQSTPNLP